jgi:RNA polymerase sigma-70 factor (ECF subfamily)
LPSAVPAKPEQTLSARLQARDPEAMAELYDLYGGIAYRLILRIVRDEGIAEDLVQETFVRVWNRCGAFDSERGALGSWLVAVARNCALDYLRSRSRRLESSMSASETEHPMLFADRSGTGEEYDAARQVRRAIDELGSRQREAIELAYFEGLSQTEVAARMGEPLGTVKTWMRRGLQQMRQSLTRGGSQKA